jgi:hypothetical protein
LEYAGFPTTASYPFQHRFFILVESSRCPDCAHSVKIRPA